MWQLGWLNPVVIPGLRASTRCAVLHGSLCVYVCIVLIYSTAKLQVCFNKLTLLYWVKATVIDRQPDRPTRIKETIYIRNEGQRAINRDEGSYQLSHIYDRFLDMVIVLRSSRIQYQLLLMKASERGQNIKGSSFILVV